ncbi:hypothetical protein WME73_04075 [Sorangium sp. So ce302]|uniref:hypothetical protein n=1 Tax=Sorangium sp. So ce302 TaxID=3133297 RepID=UPI003F5DA507
MSATASEPPLLEAWEILADGLQVHRFFLHVHPRRRARRVRRLAGPPYEARPWIALLDAIDGELPPAPEALPCAVRAEGGAFLLVRSEDRELGPRTWMRAPADADIARARNALAQIARTPIAYVVTLGAEIIAFAPPEVVPADRYTACVRVPDLVGLDLASALVAGAARELFLGLHFERDDGRPARSSNTRSSPWSGRAIPLDDFARETYEAATLFRFWSAVRGAEGWSAEWEARFAEARAKLERADAELGDVLAALGYVVTEDLVRTACPGPNRFSKYGAGAGAGQAG